MDNVTHALAGSLLAAGTVAIAERRGVTLPRSFRVVATTVGIITAELPDIDLVYAGQRLGMGSLGYLLHHRGHTHTVVFAFISALLVWLAALAFSKNSRAPSARNLLLALALIGTASHLVLDYTNNYGVHPFWPVVNKWFYGDAVFIVEPWLWIASIPALYLTYQSRWARIILGALLAIILVASWVVSMVGRDVAIAFSIATLLWFALARSSTPTRRIAYATGAWIAIELMFIGASSRARHEIQIAVGETYRDVSLTPSIGNPLCYSAIVVESEGGIYRVTNANVATFSSVRTAGRCVDAMRGGVEGNASSARATTPAIRWGTEWQRPLADLQQLVSTSCEVAAAMEFIRMPVWEPVGTDSVRIGDARFGAANGFASVTAALTPATCPRFVPGWTRPRADLLQ